MSAQCPMSKGQCVFSSTTRVHVWRGLQSIKSWHLFAHLGLSLSISIRRQILQVDIFLFWYFYKEISDRIQHQVSLVFSYKFRSNWYLQDSFGIFFSRWLRGTSSFLIWWSFGWTYSKNILIIPILLVQNLQDRFLRTLSSLSNHSFRFVSFIQRKQWECVFVNWITSTSY